ncbi:MAG: hypothetical protein OEZ06_05035 [Myxococcales bacterium]|nr:hypothetical protein [Myxococcales bacterium]
MPEHRQAPPPLLLEQLHLGELPAEQERLLLQRYGREAIDAALHELSESNTMLSARYPTQVMTGAIEARLAQRRATGRRGRLRLLWALGPALMAAAVLLMVRPSTPDDGGGVSTGVGTDPSDLEATRIKGEALEVRIFRRRENPAAAENPFIEALADGTPVRAGDVLQLGYASDKPYATMLSVDGRGTVTLHFPTAPERDAKLPKHSGLLPFAYELDDSPHFERFYLFAHNRPFPVQRVQDALQTQVEKAGRGKPPATPSLPGFDVATLELRKVKP